MRKVSPDGLITTLAGSGKAGISGDGGPATEAQFSPGGVAADATGDLFIADPVNHRIRKVSPEGIITTAAGTGPTGPPNGVSAGDGGRATEARLNGPFTLAVDRSGNLYFAEIGDVFSPIRGYRVRKVDPNGIITTVAGIGRQPYRGDGVPAGVTGLRGPMGVAVDAAGNLLITDTEALHETDGSGPNARVLKVFGTAAPGLIAGQLFPNP